MNNYIDERLIPYKRSQVRPVNCNYGRKGRPLTRKNRKNGILTKALRFGAAIFLLLLSTLGGEGAEKREKAGVAIEKAVKACLVYGGILLALWGLLVVFNNLVNAVAFLPAWSLIFIFAFTVLGAAGVLKK